MTGPDDDGYGPDAGEYPDGVSAPSVTDEVSAPSATDVAPVTRIEVPYTGHERVDDVMLSLAEVADAPPADQIARLASAHTVLSETLHSIGTV